jgi:hypothetical protein
MQVNDDRHWLMAVRSGGCDMHSRAAEETRRAGEPTRRGDAPVRAPDPGLGMRIPEKAVAPTRNLATGSSHFQYLSINGETHTAPP